MKKITSIVLLIAMLLSATLLSACTAPHKCSPAEEWTFDENSHWHACANLPYVELFGFSYTELLNASCTEIFDKADHTWDAGTITTPATQEADGTKTFTCTGCGATKTEAVPFAGMTEEEWNAVFDIKQFENFTYTETSVLKTTGMTIETIGIYEFEEGKAKVTATVAGQTESQRIPTGEIETYREVLLESIKDIAEYENYKYDAETKTYTLTGTFTIAALGAEADTATIKFEGGKLVELTYTCKMYNSGVYFDVTSTVIFSNYGTTTVK